MFNQHLELKKQHITNLPEILIMFSSSHYSPRGITLLTNNNIGYFNQLFQFPKIYIHFVCQSYHNKLHTLDDFRKGYSFFSLFCKLEVQDRDMGRAGFSLACEWLSSLVSSLGLPSAQACALICLFMKTPTILGQGPHY